MPCCSMIWAIFYMDIMKAFNKVLCGKLVQNVRDPGILANVIQTDGERMMGEGITCDWKPVTSCVLLASVLAFIVSTLTIWMLMLKV